MWADGRIGTFRGIRRGAGGYGGFAFDTKGTAALGGFEVYKPLVIEIVRFFRTGTRPLGERVGRKQGEDSQAP